MKPINNPFPEIEGYQCFGCSQDNPIGLKLNFFEDGDSIVSEWEPTAPYQGWINVLHGGIQATMLDEIASWVVFVKLKTSGVTSHIDMKLKKAVYTNKGKLKLVAKLIEVKRNLAFIQAQLFTSEGELGAEATITYFVYSEEIAKEKLMFPGHEKFII